MTTAPALRSDGRGARGGHAGGVLARGSSAWVADGPFSFGQVPVQSVKRFILQVPAGPLPTEKWRRSLRAE